MKVLFTTICFLTYGLLSGQTIIKGTIADKSDSSPLPFVSVIVYQYQTNKILSYTQTDDAGFYKLEVPSVLSILTLKTSRLGYMPYQQDIVMGSEEDMTLMLSFQLQQKTEKLAEVVIRGPIIVKEDTIIYDIAHFTSARDQTLEEVLAKIPGFKIRGDGEIQVNGKTVRKVLVDGQEVTDVGAALLTHSISPEDVESVEVRTDEKDTKLKESLLDATEYVVLDIKLKKELDKSLFGKIKATIGYQNNIEPGGYLNAFSLKQHAKIHLFAEHDRFGEQTISLDQIKNIGAEAFQKIFEIPADFQTLTEREAFDDEIYGFKNYTIAYKDIVGLSTKFTISPALDIYVGSYNSFSKDGKGRSYTQAFTDLGSPNSFVETQQIENYSSKNKLDFRYDKDKIKVRLDLNAVLFKNDYSSLNNESARELRYNYGDVHRSKSFYENLRLEYAASKKLGFSLKASYASITSEHTKNLTHNDTAYASFFVDENDRSVFDFSQQHDTDASNLLAELAVNYRTPLGVFNGGIHYQAKSQTTEKVAFNNKAESNNAVLAFTGQNPRLTYEKWGPFLKYALDIAGVSFSSEGKWVYLQYPEQTFKTTNQTAFEYKLSMSYNFGAFNYISAGLSRQISSFPLEKIMLGWDISNFQTVSIPGEFIIEPRPEMTLELSGAKKFESIDLLFDPAMLYGQIKNADRYLFTADPIISIAYDQLKSEYILMTFPLTKKFKTIPINIVLEPEWLINQNENVASSGALYRTKTTRRLFGLKVKTELEDKPYDFFFYPKYSAFIFENALSETTTSQKMLSLVFSTDLDILNEKLLITPSIRTIKFLGNVDAEFTNISLKVDYLAGALHWSLSIDNLLDNSNFVQQTIFPTYFISEKNSVFSRYFKVGLSYKF